MTVSYKKLWKLLIDKGMLKKDLRVAAGLSTNVIAKMGKIKMFPQKLCVKSVRCFTVELQTLWNLLLMKHKNIFALQLRCK